MFNLEKFHLSEILNRRCLWCLWQTCNNRYAKKLTYTFDMNLHQKRGFLRPHHHFAPDVLGRTERRHRLCWSSWRCPCKVESRTAKPGFRETFLEKCWLLINLRLIWETSCEWKRKILLKAQSSRQTAITCSDVSWCRIQNHMFRRQQLDAELDNFTTMTLLDGFVRKKVKNPTFIIKDFTTIKLWVTTTTQSIQPEVLSRTLQSLQSMSSIKIKVDNH